MLAGVVVVGYGAAGACAAIEAADAGSDVIVLDRFDGGGATALSGGVVYAGGGTAQQAKAGIADTPDAMCDYLTHEVGDAVTAQTSLIDVSIKPLRRRPQRCRHLLQLVRERPVPGRLRVFGPTRRPARRGGEEVRCSALTSVPRRPTGSVPRSGTACRFRR